jgi:hypothetical protein
VWGEKYVQEFLQYTAATLLAPSNLPLVAKQCKIHIVIATAKADFDRFSGPAMERLAEMADIEFHALPLNKIPLLSMSEGNIVGLERARSLRGTYMYSTAGQMWADGAIYHLVEKLQSYRAVMSWAARLASETLLPYISRYQSGTAMSIPPSDFGELLLAHPHEEVLGYEVSGTRCPTMPIYMVWWSPRRDCAVVRAHTLGLFGIGVCQLSDREFSEYIDSIAVGTSDHSSTMRSVLGDLGEVYFAKSNLEIATAGFESRAHFKAGLPSYSVKVEPEDFRRLFNASVTSYYRQPWVEEYAKYFSTRAYVINQGADPEFVRRITDESSDLIARALSSPSRETHGTASEIHGRNLREPWIGPERFVLKLLLKIMSLRVWRFAADYLANHWPVAYVRLNGVASRAIHQLRTPRN